MKCLLKVGLVVAGVVGLVGCGKEKPNTFTLVGELPPNFVFHGVSWYVPDPEKPCAVTDWRGTMPTFNRNWRKDYKPVAVIEVRKVIKGCEMVLDKVAIEIKGTYGEKYHHFGSDFAGVGAYISLDERFRRTLESESSDSFYGECQWLFRTMGVQRNIRKILDCKKDNERGEKGKGNVFAAYTLDQLPGKTIRMNVRLAEREEPYFHDTWVEFANGWKRCIGKGKDDVRGYCRGNYSSFSEFTMPDGRVCEVYPSCQETIQIPAQVPAPIDFKGERKDESSL